MSITADTKSYAVDVASTALSSFTKQARGDLEAPNGDENVRLFTAKGGSAVTLGTNTTSAAVVFDTEASLRNGQMNVVVYEREGSTVANVQHVNLGRPTTEFLSAGVLSSGLKVFNSSGVDVIGGTQTAAVLSSVPRDISTISSTDVSNFCGNHARDMVSGVVSREDSTMTMSMTEHFGKKMSISRSGMLSNVVLREWDDGIGSRETTLGSSLSPVVDTTITYLPGTGAVTTATALLNPTQLIVDSDRLDNDKNPLSLATYHASVTGYCRFDDPGATAAFFQATFRIIALDAAGNVLAENDVRDITSISSASDLDMTFSGDVTSTTVPIARVVVALIQTNPAITEVLMSGDSNSKFKLSAFEETSDIAARPIHVCVLEGLNSAATINIGSTAVLTGVPDSTNVFISSANAVPKIYDFNAVDIFLKSITRVLPRAFTTAGHGLVERRVVGLYNDEEVEISFRAMSFGGMTNKITKMYDAAKALGRDIQDVAKHLEEPLGAGAEALSMLPGTAGAVGRGMAVGANAARMFGRV